MNGAVMDHQDSAFLSRQKKASGQHCPEFHHQMRHSSQQNSLHKHSKATNYQLLSNPSVVDDLSQHLPSRSASRLNYKHIARGGSLDPRSKITYTQRREPLELPVPKYEMNDSDIFQCNRKQNTKDLDLDTRIDFLIKSKALACMHPIFSELDESTDSDEPFLKEINSTDKFRSVKNDGALSPPKDEISSINCDDLEEPLSRSPSPFLSRSTYLFWFNKAIELKVHAKAQEKALLEKAAKSLVQEHLVPAKIMKTGSCQEENNVIKHLLNEVSKEFKEVVKQEFINEVLESTVISTFENWWEEEQLQEINKLDMVFKSNTGFESKEDLSRFGTKEHYMYAPKDNASNNTCIHLNQSGTDIIKNYTFKGDENQEVSLNKSTEENEFNGTIYLDSINNQNNKESLMSLNFQPDVELKGDMKFESLSSNVNSSTDDITKTDEQLYQYTTSSQISKNYPYDVIETFENPGKCDAETVKKVLNLIVDNVDRIIPHVQNIVAVSEDIN